MLLFHISIVAAWTILIGLVCYLLFVLSHGDNTTFTVIQESANVNSRSLNKSGSSDSTANPNDNHSASITINPSANGSSDTNDSTTVTPNENHSASITINPSANGSSDAIDSTTVTPNENHSASETINPSDNGSSDATGSPSIDTTASPSLDPTNNASANGSPSIDTTGSPSSDTTASPSLDPTNNASNNANESSDTIATTATGTAAKITTNGDAQVTDNSTTSTQPTTAPTQASTSLGQAVEDSSNKKDEEIKFKDSDQPAPETTNTGENGDAEATKTKKARVTEEEETENGNAQSDSDESDGESEQATETKKEHNERADSSAINPTNAQNETSNSAAKAESQVAKQKDAESASVRSTSEPDEQHGGNAQPELQKDVLSAHGQYVNLHPTTAVNTQQRKTLNKNQNNLLEGIGIKGVNQTYIDQIIKEEHWKEIEPILDDLCQFISNILLIGFEAEDNVSSFYVRTCGKTLQPEDNDNASEIKKFKGSLFMLSNLCNNLGSDIIANNYGLNDREFRFYYNNTLNALLDIVVQLERYLFYRNVETLGREEENFYQYIVKFMSEVVFKGGENMHQESDDPNTSIFEENNIKGKMIKWEDAELMEYTRNISFSKSDKQKLFKLILKHKLERK